MVVGDVDEEWARRHHPKWADAGDTPEQARPAT
jgi:cytochrome b subunit of formate dehydrogenase